MRNVWKIQSQFTGGPDNWCSTKHVKKERRGDYILSSRTKKKTKVIFALGCKNIDMTKKKPKICQIYTGLDYDLCLSKM